AFGVALAANPLAASATPNAASARSRASVEERQATHASAGSSMMPGTRVAVATARHSPPGTHRLNRNRQNGTSANRRNVLSLYATRKTDANGKIPNNSTARTDPRRDR